MASPVTLPEELIAEILSFLTVKSLMRFKCVNKSWNTLISDPIFVKMHLMRSPRITHFVLHSPCSANILPISVSHLLKSWETIITLTDPYSRFQCKDRCRIVGSCNGLICLLVTNNYCDYAEDSLYFWNPATRSKSEKLGSIRSNYGAFLDVKFAFGYDNSTDTYKVVLLNLERDGELVRTAVKVFTLGDNVWKDIDCFPVVLVYYYPNCVVESNGVYLSNSINWLVCHEYNCDLKNLMIKEYVIVSLDLGTETYSQLLLPRCCNNEIPFDPTPTLFMFMDCLCIWEQRTYFVIWQMKEFGVEESWTQLLQITYRDLNISTLVYGIRLIPLCFSGDDALIFADAFGKHDAILYDWRNNRVKTIENTNEDETIRYNWHDAKEYCVESLVSTC